MKPVDLQAELDAALRAASPAASCPDCAHKVADHTARVGDTGQVCAWCDCYRYCRAS